VRKFQSTPLTTARVAPSRPRPISPPPRTGHWIEHLPSGISKVHALDLRFRMSFN
jgi:hypothetical protein